MDEVVKPKILVVDDQPKNLIAVESALKNVDLEILFANSSREALRLLLEHDFLVILLDVQMPDMDGFETARLIRAREKSSYTPIIFLSAWHTDEMDVNKGYELGAADYIFKPLNPAILRYKIKVFIDLFTKSTLANHLQEELKKRLRAEQNAIRQKYQLELAQQERINVMEAMSSTLAHELNQPLTTIANYIKGCIHRLTENTFDIDSIVAVLKRTAYQAERGGEILHRIKDFVRRSKLCLEPVAINELITRVINFMHESVEKAKIDISFKSDGESAPVLLLDKIQFEQAIINILRNSIEALEQSNLLERRIIIETYVHQKKLLIIKIKDNGLGINNDSLNKLFELYYSTKVGGMGVGLSICRTIIEAHGGNIIAANNVEGGACFKISLPLRTSNA